MLGIALALGASVAWGGSDFVAGLAARRRSLLVILAGSQAWGLAVVVAILAAGGEEAPGTGALALAGAAGIAELVGFAALYAGLARGPMGVVAPVSALGGAVPLAVGLAAGDLPGAWAAAGIVLALAGVALVSGERADREGGALAGGLLLGGVAALAFGAFFSLTAASTAAGDPTWAVAVNRATSLAILMAIVARRGRAQGGLPFARADLPAVAAIGILDAIANALFAFAVVHGVTPVVSVLGSLYPLTTLVLAQLVLREQLAPRQAAGVLATLTGVALLVV